MLYKGYSIKIWKSEWEGKRIDGVTYSLNGYTYRDMREAAKSYKYMALVAEINPQRAREVWGGSTPLIALDLAKFSIDLTLSNAHRFDMMERVRNWDKKCLKERFGRQLKNI
jgi:hypothetical protein